MKRKKLGLGARFAVMSPASSANPERVHCGVERLQQLGYQPVLYPTALAKSKPYFAGTPEQRLADLHRAFKDDSIDAILCTRGGYGANYLLAGLDLDLLRAHAKPFIGYSDHTVIETWMLDRAGVPIIYGPMAAADFAIENGVDLPSFQVALSGDAYTLGASAGLRALRPGVASGTLYGGCLSLLTASLGTPYAAQTEGKLLFLEDVGAKPYQIDRMLRQMMLAGKLEGVYGIVFGEMLDCVSPHAPADLLQEVILGVLDWFPGPIAFGLRSGHVSRENVSLPFGVEAELAVQVDSTTLRIDARSE